MKSGGWKFFNTLNKYQQHKQKKKRPISTQDFMMKQYLRAT